MSQTHPRIDAGRRTIMTRGNVTHLGDKAWQVLTMLMESAPSVVARTDIIDQIWPGRPATGEKGLNQAIWSLRTALGDDPRQPSCIRTVARVGYQWIGPDRAPILDRGWLKVACVAAAALVFMLFATDDDTLVAKQVSRVGIDVHVEFEDGNIGILKNARKADIGEPILSVDGQDIFIPVYENRDCRLVLVNLTTRQRQDFANCPSPSQSLEI